MKLKFSAALLLVCGLSLPAIADNLLQSAWDHAWRGDAKSAVQLFNDFARDNAGDPRAAAALYNAASLQVAHLDELPVAEKALQNLIAKYPQSQYAPQAYRLLGDIAGQQQHAEQAVDFYRSALQRVQGAGYQIPQAWVGEVVTAWQGQLANVQDPAQLASTYQEILTYIPPGETAAQVKYELGQAQIAAQYDAEAAKTFADLITSYPNSRWSGKIAQEDRGVIDQYLSFPWEDFQRLQAAGGLLRQLQFEQVKAIYSDINAKHPNTPLAENAEFGLIAAEVYLNGDFEDAIQKLHAYQEKYPQGLRQQDMQRRLELWDEIRRRQTELEDNPEDYGGHAQLGFTLLQNRFLPQAETFFLQALKDTSSEFADLGLGYVYIGTQRLAEGIEHFEKYLQNHNQDGSVYNQIGYAYLQVEQMDKALECFERYRDLEPDNPNAHDSYAECLFNLGKLDEAIASYQKAIEINPDFTNPYFMLGEVYQQKQDNETALSYYREYLKRDPSGFQAAQAQAKTEELTK